MMWLDNLLLKAKQEMFFPEACRLSRQTRREAGLSRDEIVAIQQMRCQKLLKFVFEKVPLYQEKYRACGIESGDLEKDDVWEKLPVLTKDEVRLAPEKLLPAGMTLTDLRCSATGGSTGEPVKFYKSSQQLDKFLGRYFHESIQLYPVDSIALVGRKVPDENSWKYKLRSLVVRPLYAHLDAKLVTPESMQQFAAKLQRFKRYYIYGYAGGIYEFSCFLAKSNIKLNPPVAVLTTSAPIADFQREKMQRVFQAPVYNQYGCCEIPWLAMECRCQNGMHVLDPARKIEIVDENNCICPDDQVGNILLTNLHEYQFPLIRYRVGDRAARLSGQCSCGCNLSRISAVRGRETDCVYLPDGGFVAGDYLTTVFDDYPHAVTAFQVIQHDLNNITLSVVVNEQYADARKEIALVTNMLKQRFLNMNLLVKEVESIASDRGKIRYIINYMNRR